MSDEYTLYRVNVKTATSPTELAEFCALLEDEGYIVATDLNKGTLEVREDE